jgi:UDP-N-acetylglucosamine diphosphorylase / glucose-1-phosphate thymidylyltransferase / UDP-N-acetylgalactosamine diphosphorylase / glucosamine-1-phosphate N-acetyltransferase / galactosamine-1-phosphate N-acetyltransferase
MQGRILVEVQAAETYFDLSDEEVNRIFARVERVWEVVARLPEVLDDLVGSRRIIKGTVMPGAMLADGPLYVGDGAVIEPGAYVASSAYIGDGVTIRHGAYVRSNCVFLPGSLLGHASEAKSALFLPGAKAPHFAYAGDSVLGQRVNLGAGTKLSNLRVTSGAGQTLGVVVAGEEVDTGLRKLGAILGDDVEIGCNAVLNPGTLVGPRSVIYPGAVVPKGFYSADTIIKLRQRHEHDAVKPT